MNFLKIVLGLFSLVSLFSCAEMGLRPHRPTAKSTLEISKATGTFRILSIEGGSSEMRKILDGDIVSCGATTFRIPRGNSVEFFIKEVFSEELRVADKYSQDGTAIEVVINKMDLTTHKAGSGEWAMDVDYTVNGKTTNITNSIEFESKVSMITSCMNTASVFEEAIADSLVEFFKRTR